MTLPKISHQNANFLLWGLLALPSIPMLFGAMMGENLEHPLREAGEFSARFLIISMIITPMRMMFPMSKIWRWMGARRRYFGVAAFSYALLHTVLYILDMGGFASAWQEAFILGIWTGWLAFFIFIPLALTSNNMSMRMMGANWKTLQRWVYLAAVATLLHWIFVHNEISAALVHFVPLAALETYRVYKTKFSTKGIRL